VETDYITTMLSAPGRTAVHMARGKRIEAGIFRLSSCKYLVEATTLGGSKRARKTVEGDIHAARKCREELREQLLQGSLKSPGEVLTVESVIDYYVKNHYARTSRYAIGSGKAIVRTLKEKFGGMDVADLSKGALSTFVFDLRNSGYANAGINPYIVTLRAAFQFCIDAGVLRIASPLAGFKVLKVQQGRKEIIPEAALKVFRENLPDFLRPILAFKELVPCRVLELLEIRMEQVDFEKRVIHLAKDQTKTEEDRDLPIPLVMMVHFERMKAWGSPWLFARTELRKDGTVVFHKLARNTISVEFRKVREAAGLPRAIVFRKLRHTVLSQWLRRYDIGLVSEVAGASPETLREYYDVVPVEAKVAAADGFAACHEHLTNTLTLSEGSRIAASA